MRVVLDTNIFISGIFWEGNFCSKIIEAWKNKKLTLITSISIIEELIKTLKNFKIQMEENMIKKWEKEIVENAIIVEPKIKLNLIKDDPEDNKFIEAGIAGNADFIISQDKHLLRLENHEKTRIIHPEEFVKLIR